MLDSKLDKFIEQSRYDKRAQRLKSRSRKELLPGANEFPVYLRAPYLAYERQIDSKLPDSGLILELAAGLGQFTERLTQGKGTVVASDISSESLRILKTRYNEVVNLNTVVCDIESLGFRADTFDLVASAGGLSYGDSEVVMNEIKRVLKPNGHFICVDSLNENPIFKANRYIHYLKGQRTKSTLVRMPTMRVLDRYKQEFEHVEICFFGGFTWLAPVVSKFFNAEIASLWLDYMDNCIHVKKMAFKFVMVARKGSS
jgi:ubiquinone/menaquinone biosynthesis C-methylase UbiE